MVKKPPTVEPSRNPRGPFKAAARHAACLSAEQGPNLSAIAAPAAARLCFLHAYGTLPDLQARCNCSCCMPTVVAPNPCVIATSAAACKFALPSTGPARTRQLLHAQSMWPQIPLRHCDISCYMQHCLIAVCMQNQLLCGRLSTWLQLTATAG
jgi:hypothetical protein